MKIWIRLGAVATLAALAGCETPPATPTAPAPAPSSPAPAASRPAPARPPSSAGGGAAAPSSSTPGAGPAANAGTTSPGSGGNAATKASAGDTLLREGVAAYEQGEFALAIRKLGAPEVLEGSPAEVQLQARKYLAFSYCVTGRRAQCRQQFDLALKSSPSFDLSAAEAGHPIWGPVFKQAKAAASARR